MMTKTIKKNENGQTDNVTQSQNIRNPDLIVAERLYSALITDPSATDDVVSSDVLESLFSRLNNIKSELGHGRTSKLWVQYMDMIDILRLFITAERTGNWGLHLVACSQMLPYFASSGHNLYAKSTIIYLKQMSLLPDQHPDVYKHFESGLHIIRRSDRFWEGLSTDLVIEQVLMRSVKATGGLTRGRGMTESQRSAWLLSMPACAQVNEAMQCITGVNYVSSEQHKELSKSRLSRDRTDTIKLLTFLETHDTFSADGDDVLCNIANGVTADDTVNADQARDVGNRILDGLDGQTIGNYSFKKKSQVVTMGRKSAVQVGDEHVQVDSQLLFQRLITAGERCGDLPLLFMHEMCSYPPALFESPGLMRISNKSLLADSIWNICPSIESHISDNRQYLLDGGSLLHRLPWIQGLTFGQICDMYVQFVLNKYGKAIVVFA